VLAGHKGSLWEGGHRVPAVAYWPGRIKAGTITDQTVLGMDLFATMMSIAGIKPPRDLKLDGVDILSMMTKDAKLPERTLFWRYKTQKAVRKGPWKLLVQGNQSKLYNLDEDLSEKKNLAGLRSDIVTALEDELAAWEQEVSAGVELRA
jgi:arylsulfatase A-like enzyme